MPQCTGFSRAHAGPCGVAPFDMYVFVQGGTDGDLARVIGCIFFVSGLITLLQTFIGDRLPIIQVRAHDAKRFVFGSAHRAPVHRKRSVAHHWAHAERVSSVSVSACMRPSCAHAFPLMVAVRHCLHGRAIATQ